MNASIFNGTILAEKNSSETSTVTQVALITTNFLSLVEVFRTQCKFFDFPIFSITSHHASVEKFSLCRVTIPTKTLEARQKRLRNDSYWITIIATRDHPIKNLRICLKSRDSKISVSDFKAHGSSEVQFKASAMKDTANEAWLEPYGNQFINKKH